MSKISVLPIKEPKSGDNIIALIQGLREMAVNHDIDFLSIQYRIGEDIYSYSLGKK